MTLLCQIIPWSIVFSEKKKKKIRLNLKTYAAFYSMNDFHLQLFGLLGLLTGTSVLRPLQCKACMRSSHWHRQWQLKRSSRTSRTKHSSEFFVWLIRTPNMFWLCWVSFSFWSKAWLWSTNSHIQLQPPEQNEHSQFHLRTLLRGTSKRKQQKLE